MAERAPPREGETSERRKGKEDDGAKPERNGNGKTVYFRDPDGSLLIKAISFRDPQLKMPPGGKLSAAEIADLSERLWVQHEIAVFSKP